jgi:hypothetical protein
MPIAIAVCLIAVAAAAALVVKVVAAATVRDWLRFPFDGIPGRPEEVLSILATNLRMLAGLFAACLVANLARGLVTTRAAPPAEALAHTIARAFVWLCDAAIVASATAHALIVGAAVGAYGGRMIAFLFPHGPVELGAYCLALSLYVSLRQGGVTLRRCIDVGVASAAGLVMAAGLEVFVTP